MTKVDAKSKLKRIRGEKVSLSPIKKKDLRTLFKWVNDPSLVRYNTWYRPVHWDGHLKWWEEISKDKNTFVFGIRLIRDEKIIGLCKLTNINWIYRSSELQIRMGDKNYHSKGYGTEAVRLLLKFASDDLNLNRVYCFVFEDNKRAIKAYTKAGFSIEGVMKKAAYINGVYKDMLIMAVLSE